MKSKVDKLNIRKSETTSVNLSKLSNVVKNDVVKKTEHNELVKKVNNININDTSDLVKKQIKTNDHHDTKYTATQEFNKLTSEILLQN